MTPAALALALALALGGAGQAAPLDAPYLNVVPRTGAEAARIKAVTRPATDFTKAEAFEAKPGGASTVRARATADAFSQPSGAMPFESELNFKLGNALFTKVWVPSPASTLASDGLGPLYNARACQRCHQKDGRGRPPEGPGDDGATLFLRVSVPAPDDAALTAIEAYLAALGGAPARTRPDPVYGGQLQDAGAPGHPPELRVQVSYTETEVRLAGGEVAHLRAPRYDLTALGYGPLGDGAMVSPRVAPPMIGLGLLEAIPAADILAGEDPLDADGDGISGRAQIVWSAEAGRPILGRFGLKAGAPTVREQSAAAFAGDMGISSPLFPAPWGDCTAAQTACRDAPDGAGGAQEIEAEGLDLVTFYARNLGVPARRDVDDPDVLRGKQAFYGAGCAACHRPKFVTDRLADQPEQSFQLIWPYTDLLLHDMGEGLADHRPEGRADGREWRTAPLWGLGLTAQVSGRTQLLHDGRARSILEAVLWHGGEAAPARDRVIALEPATRAALIRYLESL